MMAMAYLSVMFMSIPPAELVPLSSVRLLQAVSRATIVSVLEAACHKASRLTLVSASPQVQCTCTSTWQMISISNVLISHVLTSHALISRAPRARRGRRASAATSTARTSTTGPTRRAAC